MRFNPLVLIAALIVFSLLDLVLQWAKRRANQGQPQLPDEADDDRALDDDLALDHEAARDFELEREEPVVVHFPAPPPPPPPARVPVRMRPIQSQVTEVRPRGKRWTLGPGDARRGIVLMTVLGPCRAEEMDNR